MGRSAQSHGFTLIELMIVVTLLGIFAATAVPSFTNFINNNRTQSASDELLNFLQYARSTAVQKNSIFNVCLDAGVLSLKKACADTNALRTLAKPENVDTLANTAAITFQANGTVSSAATIITCHNDDFANGYTLTVQNSGSVRAWPRGKTDSNNTLIPMSTCTP